MIQETEVFAGDYTTCCELVQASGPLARHRRLLHYPRPVCAPYPPAPPPTPWAPLPPKVRGLAAADQLSRPRVQLPAAARRFCDRVTTPVSPPSPNAPPTPPPATSATASCSKRIRHGQRGATSSTEHLTIYPRLRCRRLRLRAWRAIMSSRWQVHRRRRSSQKAPRAKNTTPRPMPSSASRVSWIRKWAWPSLPVRSSVHTNAVPGASSERGAVAL